MTETNVQRTEQDSVAPLQLDRLTVEEEAASMNRGKGRQLLAIAGLAAAVVLGGGTLMKVLDRERIELERSLAVADLTHDHVDAYFTCAVPNATSSVLGSSERLHGAIEAMVERKQKAYGITLARCEEKLSGLVPALSAAQVSSDLEPLRAKMKVEAAALTRSASALREYLQDPAQAHDYVQAVARIDRLARAAVRYRAVDEAYRVELAAQ